MKRRNITKSNEKAQNVKWRSSIPRDQVSHISFTIFSFNNSIFYGFLHFWAGKFLILECRASWVLIFVKTHILTQNKFYTTFRFWVFVDFEIYRVRKQKKTLLEMIFLHFMIRNKKSKMNQILLIWQNSKNSLHISNIIKNTVSNNIFLWGYFGYRSKNYLLI